jgi:hypothetical protein
VIKEQQAASSEQRVVTARRTKNLHVARAEAFRIGFAIR